MGNFYCIKKIKADKSIFPQEIYCQMPVTSNSRLFAAKSLELKEEMPCGRRITERVKRRSYRISLRRIWYSKRGRFQSKSEAEASYYKHEEEFKKASRVYQMSAKPNADVDLKDYLLYWFEDVFSQRIENTTRTVCAYVLYDLILPNMQQDIKLR